MTDYQRKQYKAFMAKHIVKANHTGNQRRISLPKLLLEEMEWKDISYFVLEKVDTVTVRIRKLHFMEELKCK